MFRCCSCNKEYQWIAASCVGCHKPLCIPCLNSSTYCKHCMIMSEDKNDAFIIDEANKHLQITVAAGGHIILGMYDGEDGDGVVMPLDARQAKKLIMWLQSSLTIKEISKRC